MKLTTIFTTTSILALIATSNAATISHGVGNAGGASSPGVYTLLNDIAATDGDVSFTYDIIITGATVRSGDASLGNGHEASGINSFADNSAFSVEISIDAASITGGTVSFDGFTGITAAGASGSDGFTIGGTAYRISGGDVAIANNTYKVIAATGAGTTGGTFDATSHGTGNGVVLSGLSWDFTTTTASVPEPSSTALLGLGGLALILRRRK